MHSIIASVILYVTDVIHTVGPDCMNQGRRPDLLSRSYSACLRLMSKNKLRSIAFPCVSTGKYKYPSRAACPVALETVRAFLEKNSAEVDRVIFCLFLEKDVKVYEEQMQLYFNTELGN